MLISYVYTSQTYHRYKIQWQYCIYIYLNVHKYLLSVGYKCIICVQWYDCLRHCIIPWLYGLGPIWIHINKKKKANGTVYYMTARYIRIIYVGKKRGK